MTNKNIKILVTGIAGFIGFHTTKRLTQLGYSVLGFDNLNDYYDVNLKYSRLNELGITRKMADSDNISQSSSLSNLKFLRLSLENRNQILKLFESEKFDFVCHLAAQAGVRYSIENPYSYIESNIVGFLNILEGCRQNNIKHLTYASSSSVYGLNEKMPLSESDSVDHPISLYAVTKRSNELMAHSYSHLYDLPTTGLRFFTVYGPWGRPDMSPILFASAIKEGRPIKVYNYGNMMRDFTYIDDIVEGIVKVLFQPSLPSDYWDSINPLPSQSKAPYKIYNIGHSSPVKLIDFIETIEKELNKDAIKEFVYHQPGDVINTYADITELEKEFKYHPQTSIEKGIKEFIEWFNSYYK